MALPECVESVKRYAGDNYRHYPLDLGPYRYPSAACDAQRVKILAQTPNALYVDADVWLDPRLELPEGPAFASDFMMWSGNNPGLFAQIYDEYLDKYSGECYFARVRMYSAIRPHIRTKLDSRYYKHFPGVYRGENQYPRADGTG